MKSGQFDTNLGPLLVGIFFNTYLYGLVTFQYASYHATSLNDPAWIKLFVFSLFVLDTFHSASLIYMAWVFCVENFSKPAVLREIMWPYPFTVIVISMTAFLTHMFLAYRVFRLKKNTFVYGVMLLLSAASWVTGVICGTYCWRVKSLMVTEIRSLVTAWLCLEVGADALVSGGLAVVLSRSRTGFHKSDTVLNRLIRGSVQTGLFAGIFSIITLVCFLKSPRTQFFGMFGIPISRMYSNTLMDTLLVRHRLRGTLINGMSECETDAIWMLNDPIIQRTITQSSVRCCTPREIHTNAKNHDSEAQSHATSVDIVEELRAPKPRVTKTTGGST